MVIDTDEILRHVESREKHHGEVDAYINSMNKLPDYDYSRFYETYAGYEKIITQGDTLSDMMVINLPDPKTSNAKVLILSNTCDIDINNERKYPAKILYAPLMLLTAYAAVLKSKHKVDGSRKYTDKDIESQLKQIRNQKISQIFYLPKGQGIEEECIVFLDNICSLANESVDGSALSSSRMTSLSMYGWHVLLVKLTHFFTKLTNETVELRLK